MQITFIPILPDGSKADPQEVSAVNIYDRKYRKGRPWKVAGVSYIIDYIKWAKKEGEKNYLHLMDIETWEDELHRFNTRRRREDMLFFFLGAFVVLFVVYSIWYWKS